MAARTEKRMGLAAACAVFVWLASGTTARSETVETLPQPVPTFGFKGAELCVRCHRVEQNAWIDTATTAAWRHDAHSRSHLALRPDNPRTRGMEQVLGIKAARTAACVACHTHPAGEPEVEEETDVVHAGISCETCHGAASGYFEPHMEKRWRFMPSAEKEALGMHDLRHPVRKSENCLSCHLGDPRAGKVVTHGMYAAGHPPLPAFDVESFGRAMQPHWKRVWEKGERIQAQAADAGYRTETASESVRSLIGGLVALERTVTLVRDHARVTGAASWPEPALYDCQACHHDLRIPSWRQEIGYGGLVPGRPSLVRWPRPLASVALAEAGMPADIAELLADSRVRLNRRPFGTAMELGASDAEPRERIRAAITRLEAIPRDGSLPARERAIVVGLAQAGENTGDFESARTLAWVLATTMDDAVAWSDDVRRRHLDRLRRVLALDFPQPAYPAAGSDSEPFWRTSLSAAQSADMDRIHEAFRLPPPDAVPGRPGGPPAGVR